MGSAAGRAAGGLLSTRDEGSPAAASEAPAETQLQTQMESPKQRVVKKYAAVMFHTSITAFEPPLVNLEPMLSDQWAVRLFLPVDDFSAAGEATFERSKQSLLGIGVVAVLKARGVEVEVLKQHMTDLAPNARFGAKGSFPVANNFALRRESYEAIPEEHILLYQPDGAFCANHTRSLESFMHHPWLGAPWNPQIAKRMQDAQDGSKLHLLYGNGGMSIRSKAFVLDCIDRKQYHGDWVKAKVGKGLPEDIFFSRCLFEHHKDAVSLEESAAFSAEEMFVPGNPSLIVHDPCRVANLRQPGKMVDSIGCATEEHRYITRELVRRCPEAKRVMMSRCVADCSYGFSMPQSPA